MSFFFCRRIFVPSKPLCWPGQISSMKMNPAMRAKVADFW